MASQPRYPTSHSKSHLGAFATALALSIVKTKPPDLHISDYLSQLYQKYKQRGQCEQQGSLEMIETATALAIEPSTIRCRDAKIRRLEKENAMLVAALQVYEPSFGMIDVDIPGDDDVTNSEKLKTRTALLYYIFFSGQLMNQDERDPSQLYYYLTGTLRQVEILCQTDELGSDGNDARLQEAIMACQKALRVIYHGLSLLDATQKLHNQLIALVVQHFHDLVNALEVGRASNAGLEMARQETSSVAVVKILISHIHLLDQSKVSHRILFEGYASVILAATGKELYSSVFGHKRAPTVAEEITLWEHVEAAESRQQSVSSGAKALVMLLKHIVSTASAFLEPNVDCNSHSASGSLSSKLKARLQYTLVTAVFGPDMNGIEVPFTEALQLPSLDKTMDTPLLEDQPNECFIQAVWDTVGWDILIRNVEDVAALEKGMTEC